MCGFGYCAVQKWTPLAHPWPWKFSCSLNSRSGDVGAAHIWHTHESVTQGPRQSSAGSSDHLPWGVMHVPLCRVKAVKYVHSRTNCWIMIEIWCWQVLRRLIRPKMNSLVISLSGVHIYSFTSVSSPFPPLWSRPRRPGNRTDQLRVRSACVGRLGLLGRPRGRRRSAGRSVEVPSSAPRPGEPPAGLHLPQHSGRAQAGQHQQRQRRLRPQRRGLPSAGLGQHDLPSLRARRLRLRAPRVHRSGNHASESHQHLLQGLNVGRRGWMCDACLAGRGPIRELPHTQPRGATCCRAGLFTWCV